MTTKLKGSKMIFSLLRLCKVPFWAGAAAFGGAAAISHMHDKAKAAQEPVIAPPARHPIHAKQEGIRAARTGSRFMIGGVVFVGLVCVAAYNAPAEKVQPVDPMAGAFVVPAQQVVLTPLPYAPKPTHAQCLRMLETQRHDPEAQGMIPVCSE